MHTPLLSAVSVVLALVLVSACGSDSARAPSHGQAAPRITESLIPQGRYARHRTRRMNPRYITIHATENRAAGADARAHAELLRRGALKGKHNSLGYLSWHYTVDDHSIYQSLPDNEQGQHADYEGKGNRSSIGIEMCENRGHDRQATIDRTARLTAYLMKKHDIPLSRVVPHHYWRRIRYSDGRDLGQKDCPHFLMTNGRPGPKWDAFLKKVRAYRARH